MAPTLHTTVILTFHEGLYWHGIALAPQYLDLLKGMLASDEGQGLYSCSESELQEPGVRLYTLLRVLRGGAPQLVAALRCHERSGEVYYGGAIVAPEFRDLRLLKELIAHVGRCERERDPHRRHTCVVRIYPSGELNEPAMRSFLACGFVPSRVLHHAVHGSAADRHLALSLETDGSIRVMELQARVAASPVRLVGERAA